MNALTLTRECPDCEEGRRYVSKWGGNDPDVWTVRCDRCDGTGELMLWCEGWKCHEPATELVRDGTSHDPYCAHCAALIRAEISEETES